MVETLAKPRVFSSTLYKNFHKFLLLKMTAKNSIVENIFLLDDPPLISTNRDKEDFLIIPASSGTNKFNENMTIIYTVTGVNNYLYLPGSFLRCEYEIQKEDGTALGNDNITLENNWFPKLFDNFNFKVGSREIENINYPGECDSMLKMVRKSNNYSNDGWIIDRGDGEIVEDVEDAVGADYVTAEIKSISDKLNKLNLENTGYLKRKTAYNTVKKNILDFNLAPLLGYLDYDKISHNLVFELSIRRNINNKKIFFGEDGKNAKINIKNIEWLIPQITPSLEIQNMISKRLLQDKPIPVNFLKRSMHKITIVGASYNWSILNTKKIPRYVFLTFYPTNQPEFKDNNSLTVMKNNAGTKSIKHLQVTLDELSYPKKPMLIEIENNKYADPFKAYEEMCRNMDVVNQLDIKEFKDLYPIFCFDVSAFSEKINNSINIVINIEKDDGFPLNCYCLILAEESLQIQTANGRMNEIIN